MTDQSSWFLALCRPTHTSGVSSRDASSAVRRLLRLVCVKRPLNAIAESAPSVPVGPRRLCLACLIFNGAAVPVHLTSRRRVPGRPVGCAPAGTLPGSAAKVAGGAGRRGAVQAIGALCLPPWRRPGATAARGTTAHRVAIAVLQGSRSAASIAPDGKQPFDLDLPATEAECARGSDPWPSTTSRQ